jgi:HSP20 family protein
MTTPARQERGAELTHPISWMDRVLDEWMRSLPLRRPFGAGWEMPGEELIRVDEYRDGDTQVIRAELPGIDPAKDVELTVTDGVLRINAERKVVEKTEDTGYLRHELHYGRLTRTLPLAEGATESDISATYQNGILEVRVPIAEPREAQPTRISISKK